MSKHIEESKQLKVEEIIAELPKLEESKPEQVKPSREELKARFRRAEMQYRGRLSIEDKYKRPGKTLRIDNDDHATRKYLEMLGYTPVVDREVKVGDGSLSEAHHNMGSEVHIEQGIRFSQPGILYEIDDEILAARRELEGEDNDSQLTSTVESAQREDQKLQK